MLATTNITVEGYLELIRIYNDISDTSINRWEEESNKILNATKGTQTQDFNIYLSVLGPSLSDIQGVRAISGINQRILNAEEKVDAIINAK